MEDKFCSNCGAKLEEGQKFCSNCNKEINFRKQSDLLRVILDIVRYIIGVLLIIVSINNLISGNWYGIIELILAFSCFPFLYRNILEKFVNNKKLITGLQIVVPMVFLVLLIVIVPNQTDLENNSDTHSNSTPHYNENSSTNSNEVKELTESDKMIIKISNLIDEGLAFDTGSYVKGDIPAGEYAFVKFAGSGSYYSEEDAAGNIIDNENFDSFGYVKVHAVGDITTRGVLINVSSFKKLGVSGAKEIYEILNEQENYNQAGYYKVGVDIPAGKYVVESIGSGYYAIMTGPVSDNRIVDNDNFNGKATVNLKNGQYLDLSRAQIIQ